MAKRAAVEGALRIVRRQQRAANGATLELSELAAGTAYVPVIDGDEICDFQDSANGS